MEHIKNVADELLLRKEPREAHPEGQFAAVCLDLIDLGMRVSTFPGAPESASHSCVFVFGTGEKDSKGFEFTIPYECNVTFGERSKLIKFLTQWRGKPFSPEELGTGFKLSSLVGKTALVSLVGKTSKSGNAYVVIDTIMPLPKGMTPPVLGQYKRPDFWAQRKIEYRLAFDAFQKRVMRRDVEGSGELHVPDEPLGNSVGVDETPF